MPDRVLIANRGEIAVRIARTLTARGIESVAVCSPEDAGAPHARACDRAVALPANAERSPYLDVERLVGVAVDHGCDAVHPGYGFLAERADAAQAFTDAGVTWIGPPPAAIDLLGDKIRSKETADAAGVPVVPGLEGSDVDEAAVVAFADEVGLPLLLKATAGGGGKGMRRVDDRAAIPGAVDAARREAQAAFGRGELLVERLVQPARHVEVQVAVDEHGGAWAIGERECSLQRRHQKVLEEAPTACLTDAERTALHDAAVQLAVAAGYRNLGTVEFLLDVSGTTNDDGTRPFFFLEMNARLQVEHPVTELVHGLDLVALQLRIADGEPLGLGEDDPAARRGAAAGAPGTTSATSGAPTGAGPAGPPAAVGHAIEARITAERIAQGPDGPRFLPAVGPVLDYVEPTGPGVRVDSGVERGTVVTTSFDPMLMKVIAFGRDREQALARLDRALAGLVLLGVETNAGFLRRLLARDEVVADASTTTLLEELLVEPEAGAALAAPPVAARDRALAALAADRHRRAAEHAGPGAFATPDAWRIGAAGRVRLELQDPDDERVDVLVRVGPDGLEVTVGDAEAATSADPGARTATDGPWTWLHDEGGTWSWRDVPEVAGGPGAVAGGLVAPLPGVVLAVRAAVGDAVTEGQSLVVMESMKMELDVAAPHDGTVTALDVAVGDHVARGQTLAAVEEQA
ncbi:biotin carboxylase N-terminal domain-containing protein [Patulibacter sp.]|uniref:acetyl/propionyl/methylcrotonyl-CoA carboxylase subunit alpha n=1 Tax=Patulibacter sp. TaxID=1912859 RepID=UPI00271A57C9|nr:biotin carboxylase N-terminal domain-containing protein [Patulibacter sp.]MDO9409366.1 biotin carboxylase N-terminal domain-containing protein [Patulibacter sp.]